MARSKHRWATGPAREVERDDGGVRLEQDVRRDGKVVGRIILVGPANMAEFTDLQAWFLPGEVA